MQEFYRRSGIDEHLVKYVRAYQAEGDRLRAPTSEMVRSLLLTYLHTQPITTSAERVEVKNPEQEEQRKRHTVSRRKNVAFWSCRICWRSVERSTSALLAMIITPLSRKERNRVHRSCGVRICST